MIFSLHPLEARVAYTVELRLASAIARSMGKLYTHLEVPDAKGLVDMILSEALASRQDAAYIASVLKKASEMPEFLSQHTGNIMEWLGSPLLRGKLSSLLQLSPEEAMQLSQSVGGDFQDMLRMAEFKQAFEQFSKLVPDVARVLSWSPDGMEVGVEKSLVAKLYPGIQKGTVVEFEFARGSVVLKGLLTYAEEKALGDTKYLVFAFKAEERIPAIFELLKEDLKVIPGQQVEKSFGFNAFSFLNGKLTMDKGNLGIDGSVRFSNGMVLRMNNLGIKLVASENPLETGTINKMFLTGDIGGTSVVIGEDGGVKAFYGGSYLPAVITANPLGLQLGLLAKPSGETLTITGESLLARGIQEPGLLNVVYPNGETSTVIYTGGSLQTPLLTYSLGAFLGIQAVETKIVWTSIGRDEFYSQIASISGILGSVLGRGFAEELVKTLLLSGLTDSQALDIANELVRNVEWPKSLSANKRIDIVKKIAEYVKTGETAEEAIERVKRESEEYVKSVENGIIEFCLSISDTQLANEVNDLLRHILNTLGPDAAGWLLNLLRNVYYGALTQSRGDREFANLKLRDVVEKVFDYPESRLRNCMIATTITSQLMRLEEALSSGGEEIVVVEFEKTISESGHIRCKGKFEKGLYLIRVLRKEDGEVFEWSTRRDEAGDVLEINVPEKLKSELAGKEVKITILKYDYSMHFKSKGPNFYFSPRDELTVEGREIELERIEPYSWSQNHGTSMKVKIKERSIESGVEVFLVFYEDGNVDVLFGGVVLKAKLNINGNLMIIEYEGHKTSVLIAVQKWKVGEEYYLNIPVKEGSATTLVRELRKVFGYYNTEELRKKIKEGELMLVAHFDNGKESYCRNKELGIGVPEVAKVLRYIEILRRPKPSYSKKLGDEEAEKIMNMSEDKLGDYGMNVAKAYIEDGRVTEIGKPKFIGEDVRIKVTDERVDLVYKTDDNKLVVIEVKSSKTSEDYLARYVKDGLDQLNRYKEHIQEYSLDFRKGRN